MRIAELISFHNFSLREGSIPDPGPGEVQVDVRAVGICGSDVHYFAEGAIGDTPCVYPMVLGHEPAGVIRALGAGVSGISKGDRVVLEPAIYCYHCEACLTGHHNVCAKIRFMSTPSDPGFFRERVNLPATNVMGLPDSVSFAEGTITEPLSVILHSMDFVKMRLGETAAVFGAGPIGLCTIAALKLNGASRIFSVEPLAHRREMAKAMGATDTIDPKQCDPVREILKATGQRGVDAAVDCVAKDESVNQSLLVTRNAGRVIITGIPSEQRMSLDFHTLRRKEISFYSVRRSNHSSVAALDLLRAELPRFAPMITHQRDLESIQSSFELLEGYAEGAGKVVLTM